MALLGTASNGQSSAVGAWCELTLSAAATITANAETSHTVTLPTGTNVVSTMPITATCLLSGSTAIQGGSNAWGAGIGLRLATLSGSTLTLTFAATAAAAANIPSGSRIVISNINGI